MFLIIQASMLGNCSVSLETTRGGICKRTMTWGSNKREPVLPFEY